MQQRVIVMSVEELKKSGSRQKVHSFTINKSTKSISSAEEKKMLVDLFDNMRSDRLQHERKMAKSMEFARSYTCKD